MNHAELERWYRRRLLMRVCQVAAVVLLVVLAGWYGISRAFKDTPEAGHNAPPEAGIRIRNFSYSSPGVHPWELSAELAVVAESLDHVSLTRPKMVYSGGAGGTIVMESDTGVLDKKSSNVSAKGDVRISYRDILFRTEEISYRQDQRKAETSAPVSVESKEWSSSGTGLSLSMVDERLIIEKDVTTLLFNVKWVAPGRGLPM